MISVFNCLQRRSGHSVAHCGTGPIHEIESGIEFATVSEIEGGNEEGVIQLPHDERHP
jgi:hypothetical protein